MRFFCLLVSLFVFSFNANATMCHAQYGGGFSSGDIVDMSVVLKNNPTWRLVQRCEAKVKRITVFMGYKVTSCPANTTVNPKTGKCEDVCEQMEGESLGTITFPAGTRDVASLCRNSCKAKSDLFFPAATPPYGVFTYTGESCDGSESSGGETGGGETGGGETGGGETGGGETGGGETGGGETGGGETGGGETGGGET
ncbi:hypothetical protein AB6D15_22225, partial [Vibrio splendidus]